MTKTLTIAETDALFAGTLAPKAPAKRLEVQSRPYVARYDRCSACGEIAACLSTFSGDTDWSPQLPLDDPLRAVITQMRKVLAKRTILLCSPDCYGLVKYRPTTPPVVESARLFEL